MSWQLKNKTLEEELCRMFPGFLEALNHAAKLSFCCTNYVAVEFNRELDNGDTHENHLVFSYDELEIVYEYNPNDWNEYPKVKPPENRLMMFNGMNRYGDIYIGSAVYHNGLWLIPKTSQTAETGSTYLGCKLQPSSLSTGKFKPWED